MINAFIKYRNKKDLIDWNPTKILAKPVNLPFYPCLCSFSLAKSTK